MIRYNKQSITNNDLNTLIELWRLDNVLDDYGNNQSTEVKVMDVYASVRNVNKYRQMKYNEMGYQSNVDITFRYVSDKFDFIKINGTEYTINDINNRDNLYDLYRDWETDRKSTRLNSSHSGESRMPSSA